MCDYSLETTDQREARSEELLVTARIGEHKTIGLVSPGKPDMAVCLIDGTRARINVSPGMYNRFGIPRGPAMATFRQRELPDSAIDYRDGFVFDDVPNVLRLLQDFDLDVAIVPIEVENEVVHERELVDA